MTLLTGDDLYNGTHEERMLRRLFLHVIVRAVEEAKGINLICGRRERPEYLQRAARYWLSHESFNLHVVCHWAGVPIEKILKEFEGYRGQT